MGKFALLLVAFAALLAMAYAADGGPCTPGGPGNVACNSPFFCLENSYQASCNCFAPNERCGLTSECCSGMGCDIRNRCAPFASQGDACNIHSDNCDKAQDLYCLLDQSTGTGTCVARKQTGDACTLNAECSSSAPICANDSGIWKCGNARTPDGKDCSRPTPPVIDPSENECETGSYCQPQQGGGGLCRPKIATHSTDEGSLIKSDELCLNGNWCASGFCFSSNTGGARAWALCMASNTGRAPATRCFANSDCLSNICLPGGYCAEVPLKTTGEACSHSRECITEICKPDALNVKRCALGIKGDKCFYIPGNENKQSYQCEENYECLKPASIDVRGTCAEMGRGSNPLAIARRDYSQSALAGEDFPALVGIKNNGKDETDKALTVQYRLINTTSGNDAVCGAGTCVGGGSASVSINPPVAPYAEQTSTVTIKCPSEAGVYFITANITDVKASGVNLIRYYDMQNSFATGSVYCSTTASAASSTGWQAAAFAALLINVTIVVLLYMGARAASSQHLQGQAYEEAAGLAVTVGVAVFVLLLLPWANTIATQISCAADPAGHTCNLDETAIAKARSTVSSFDFAPMISNAQKAVEEVSAESAKSGSCNFVGVGFSVPGCSAWGVARSPLTQLMSAEGFGLMDQMAKEILLTIADMLAMKLIIPMGILLRAMRFSRQAGSVLIALGFSLYFVFPLSMTFGYYIAEQFAGSPDAARFGNVATPSVPTGIYECKDIDPDENSLTTMLSRLDAATDGIIFMVIVRGLFVTFFAIAMTFASVRFLGQMLGTEIEVYQLARLS